MLFISRQVLQKCKAHGTYYNVVSAVLVVSAAFQLRQREKKNSNSINRMLFGTRSKCFDLWQVFLLVIRPLTIHIDRVHICTYSRLKYHRPTPAETTEAKRTKFKLRAKNANKKRRTKSKNIQRKAEKPFWWNATWKMFQYALNLNFVSFASTFVQFISYIDFFRSSWMKVYLHGFISSAIKQNYRHLCSDVNTFLFTNKIIH